MFSYLSGRFVLSLHPLLSVRRAQVFLSNPVLQMSLLNLEPGKRHIRKEFRCFSSNHGNMTDHKLPSIQGNPAIRLLPLGLELLLHLGLLIPAAQENMSPSHLVLREAAGGQH